MYSDPTRAGSCCFSPCSWTSSRDFASSSRVIQIQQTFILCTRILKHHDREPKRKSHLLLYLSILKLRYQLYLHRIFAVGDISNSVDRATEQPLGILPHQIRGSLSQFSQMTLIGYSSDSCTACSHTVSLGAK